MENILVVDDDRELRDTIAEVLQEEGFQVATAESADQALELLAENSFHLILLDMVMPGTDGISAIVLFKKAAPATRIIIMTAYASVQNAVNAMQRGADDYLTKPVKIATLLTTIRQNLAERHFGECAQDLAQDELFQGFANPLRRRIITILKQQGAVRFMDLVRMLEVDDHTKVNFHLKMLRKAELITQDEQKNYILTLGGAKAADCLLFIMREMGGEP